MRFEIIRAESVNILVNTLNERAEKEWFQVLHFEPTYAIIDNAPLAVVEVSEYEDEQVEDPFASNRNNTPGFA